MGITFSGVCMLFFEDRSRQIRVVRADVDASGASSKVILGLIPKRELEIGQDLRSQLVGDEVDEVEAVVDAYRKADELRIQRLALTFPVIVREVMEYFETANTTERSLIGAGILDGIRRLRKFERSVGKQNAGGETLQRANGAGSEAE